MARIESQLDARQLRAGSVLFVLMLLAFPVLAARLIFINTSQREELIQLARQQQQSHSVIPARRGQILDRKDRCLATTRFAPDVFVDPTMVENWDELSGHLAARLNMPRQEILDAVARRPNSHYVVLAKRVDQVTADAVMDIENRKGVGLTSRAERIYPLESQLAHVLGFVGAEGHGLEGLELSLDEHLAGIDGRVSSIRDARRRAIYQDADRHRDPVDGGHVVLTIDAVIQDMVEKSVAIQVDEFDAESGVGLAMDPKTGEILAMAIVPTFDANLANEVDASVRRNRALTDPVEPGSTFKPFIASGALDADVIDFHEEFDCHQGKLKVGRRLIKDTHPYDKLDITGVITKSSNVAMAQIAQRMGNPLLHHTISSFGFGTRSGVQIPGESSGLVYALKNWDSYSTSSVSFGYEVGVTPLQLITGFCALLNDGVLLKPRVIKELRSHDGSVIERYEGSDQIRQVVSPEVADFITRVAMRSVVEQGNVGQHVKGPYRVLGKTGTAKLIKADRTGYEAGAYLSTFMGAAPVEDPQIAVVVMIRRPDHTKGYYGTTVAAPAVGRVIHTALEYLEVAPDNQIASSSAFDNR